MPALRELVCGANGQLSTMRIATLMITLVVLGMWVTFCFLEGRLIPLSWQDVTIISGAQAAKAAQGHFEWGDAGVWGQSMTGGIGSGSGAGLGALGTSSGNAQGNPWDGEGL